VPRSCFGCVRPAVDGRSRPSRPAFAPPGLGRGTASFLGNIETCSNLTPDCFYRWYVLPSDWNDKASALDRPARSTCRRAGSGRTRPQPRVNTTTSRPRRPPDPLSLTPQTNSYWASGTRRAKTAVSGSARRGNLAEHRLPTVGADPTRRRCTPQRDGSHTAPRCQEPSYLPLHAHNPMKPFSVARYVTFMFALAQVHSTCRAAAEPDGRAEARWHFEQGVAAFNQRRFGEAAKEFQEAYQLSPHFSVLYNIGQVNVALGRPVEAVEAFERYLAEGGSAISAARKTAVQAELDTQRVLLGTVAVAVAPAGAEIRMDGKSVGHAPLDRSVKIAAGQHTLMAFLDGYRVQTRELLVQPGEHVQIQIELEPIPLPEATRTAPGDVPAHPSVSPPKSQSSYRAEQARPKPAARPSYESSSSTGSAQRIVGYALGGLGMVAAGVGVVLAVKGFDLADQAKSRKADAGTEAEWKDANSDFQDAKSQHLVGWEVMGLGAIGIAGGVVLLATAPAARSGAAWWVAPWGTAQTGGLAGRAVW
jgi:tetratricopeptide (TPR) repeat protein